MALRLPGHIFYVYVAVIGKIILLKMIERNARISFVTVQILKFFLNILVGSEFGICVCIFLISKERKQLTEFIRITFNLETNQAKM